MSLVREKQTTQFWEEKKKKKRELAVHVVCLLDDETEWFP